MRECNNSKIHISSNFLLSKSLIQHPVIRSFKIYLRIFCYYIIVKFKSAETN